MLPPCAPGPTNPCDGLLPVLTGRVVPLVAVVDCEGQCHGGRCDGRCPQQGDSITYFGKDANGEVVVHDDSNGRTYACGKSTAGVSFDCADPPSKATGFVSARSVEDQHCTGAAFGGIGIVVDGVATSSGSNTCSYDTCSVQPGSGCAP